MLEQNIVPMEPQAAKMLHENPDYVYQVKWDGVRLLAFVGGKKVRLQGKSLKNKTALYPELSLLPELVKGRNAILDGEIIAFQGDRPSFYTVMQREGVPQASVAWLSKKIPVYYMVFDLLFFDGIRLLEKPWEARQEIIAKYVVADDHLQLTPTYRVGETLLKTVQEKRLEGIVAKKKDSPYIPGPRRSTYWQKIKLEQTIKAYVGGVSIKGGKPVSLLLGLAEEETEGTLGPAGKLRYIGNVSSGLREKDLVEWQEKALENKCLGSPFTNFVPSSGKEYLFIQPSKKVQVTFSEWTPSVKLRAPRLEKT